ncbi:MAG: methionyl-tRNA formyltransferase [Porticoccaceae bacterium]|nr:methionyl-tRNA formyltransferase [Porticoccaceae bacterium]
MKIIFAGTPPFAAEHLKTLLENIHHEVVCTYTQPDRPSGRGRKELSSPVKNVALENNLAVRQPISLNNSTEINFFKELAPEILIVVAYGLIIPKAILDIPRYGCINVHTSILPRWRGAAPIQRAIEAGDKKSGISIMQMDAGLDTGPILASSECDIDTNDSAGSLESKLMSLGPPLLLNVLTKIKLNDLDPTSQNNFEVSYAHKIKKNECQINWFDSAMTLERRIRAFNPTSVMFSNFKNERLKIWMAKAMDLTECSSKTAKPGEILSADNEGLLVQCNIGKLLITNLQMPGKIKMSFSEILKSRKSFFTVGCVFEI